MVSRSRIGSARPCDHPCQWARNLEPELQPGDLVVADRNWRVVSVAGVHLTGDVLFRCYDAASLLLDRWIEFVSTSMPMSARYRPRVSQSSAHYLQATGATLMSAIEWTGISWTVRITGCSDASTGCLNCYARPMSFRQFHMGHGDKYPAALTRWSGGALKWTGASSAIRICLLSRIAGADRNWCSSTRCPTRSTRRCRRSLSEQFSWSCSPLHSILIRY